VSEYYAPYVFGFQIRDDFGNYVVDKEDAEVYLKFDIVQKTYRFDEDTNQYVD
jgi:hypothetical protein